MGTSPRRHPAAAGIALAAVLAASSCGGRAPESERAVVTAEPTVASTTITDSADTTAASPETAAPESTVPTVSAPPGGYASVIVPTVVDNPSFDGFERDITALMEKAGLPGASLLVVQHGELVEQEAWMDYTLDTIVPIASGSKWLSAATIMTLVDDGLLDLDEPIGTYIPDVGGPNIRSITLRQLLSFTSGLVDSDRVPCTSDASYTLQTCAAQIAKAGVVHPPGATFRYSSQHLIVAAAIAELVSGKPFTELFAERIAVPLGMTNTYFFETGDPTADVVDFPGPAGGAASTLGDYGRFLEMIYHDGVAPDGTRILQSATIAEMQSNQIADASYGTAAAFRVEQESPYGLGEWIDWTRPDGSALVISSDGSFGFRPWIDKENDLFGVYMIDDRGSGYVEGDPSAATDDGSKVHTSGNWIFEWVAEALGGSLPEEKYPARN